MGRGSDTWEIEVNFGSNQAVRGYSFNEAMLDSDSDPHLLQALQVKINWPGADIAASGQRHTGPSKASEKRSENGKRGAHLLDQLVGSFMRNQVGRVEH